MTLLGVDLLGQGVGFAQRGQIFVGHVACGLTEYVVKGGHRHW